jgi:hypothetical protein
LGVGFSTSFTSRTSGGPYFVHTMAFICVSFLVLKPETPWHLVSN